MAGSLYLPPHRSSAVNESPEESTQPKIVETQTLDKKLPPYEGDEINPDKAKEVRSPVVFGDEPLEKMFDFRPLQQQANTVSFDDVVPEDEDPEVIEEVLTAPKDSSALESVESSPSETTEASESSAVPASPATVEKDNGQPKEAESGTQTSSPKTSPGKTKPPASK
jgi:hypothetical protein